MMFLKTAGLISGGGKDDHRENVRHSIAMLEMAATLDRFFVMGSPLAPGAFFCGGSDSATEDRRAGHFAGRGFDLGQAFLSCVGEAAEYRAMSRMGHDPRITAGESGSVVTGRSLVSGASITVPAGSVLRDATGVGPSSTGYAAGPTIAGATESAFLECVERDAIARWWRGETMPSEIAASDAIVADMDAIRRPALRPVVFADMSPTGALAYAVTAVSSDATLGTAFGFGSGFSLESACRGALLELCQGEIGLMMTRRKASETGFDRLAPKEREALDRAAFYRPGIGLLAFRRVEDYPARDNLGDLSTAIARAARSGRDVVTFEISLPRDNIPVVKVLIDGLDDAAILESEPGRPRLL